MQMIKRNLTTAPNNFLLMKLANTPEKFNIFHNYNCFGIAVYVKRALI